MHLIIASTPYSESQLFESTLQSPAAHYAEAEALASGPESGALSQATEDAPVIVSATTSDAYERIREWLDTTDSAHLVAFHTRPESAVARALADDANTVAEAATTWVRGARALLGIVRRNRRRATLFDADIAARAPEAYAARVGDRLGLDPPEPNALPADDRTAPGALEHVIAAQVVAGSAELQELRDELEASSIPLDDTEDEPAPDCEAALQAYREAERIYSRVQQEAAGLRQDVDERDEQLRQVQAELDAVRGEARKQEAARDKAKEEAGNLEQQLQERGEENELLLLQLHQVQEELEKHYLDAQEKESARDKAQKDADSLKQQLGERDEQLRGVQAELEAARGEAREQEAARDKAREEAGNLEQQLQERGEENELLLLQLHQVQEELETYYLEAQDKEAARYEATQEAEKLRKELQDRDEQLRQRDATDGGIRARLAAARERRKRRRRRLRLAKELAASEWFDAKWYLRQYPDVAAHRDYGKRPALHYLVIGGFEGRNPGPDFDSVGYLEVNADVRENGENPLLHFLHHGREEGRQPNPYGRDLEALEEEQPA